MSKLNSGVFNNKVAIVTGASSGIGRELAYQLAKQGAQLVLAARDRLRLEEVANNCQTIGSKAIAVTTDVTKQEDCQQLIATTLATYGGIDMLINAAARSIGGYAAAKRQREMVIPWQGKLGLWLNFLFPHLTDRLIAKVALAHKQRIDSLRAEVGEL